MINRETPIFSGILQWITLLLISSCLLVNPPVAQGQQPEGNDKEASQDFFELPPFEVSTSNDRGYVSTNSTSGTSLNSAIRDLPIPLEVLNQEFMQDLQATDMDETLAYSAGVFTQTFQTSSSAVSSFNESSPSAVGNVNDPFQNAVSIRGYKVPNQQRLGFRVGGIVPAYGVVLGGSTDTITTERTEVVRGPQALLYGINVLSGIVNLMPKRPLPKNLVNLGVSVGSDDFYRATLDATGPVISDVLNYRLMAAWHEQGDPYGIMFRDDERWTTALQLDYKISKRISLFVEYAHAEQESTGVGEQFFEDDGSGGTSGFDWHNDYGENFRYGYDDHTQQVMDQFGNFWDSPVVEKSGRRDYGFTDFGNHYNISGPDTYLKREENNLLALLTVTPTKNLSLEAGAYYTEVKDELFNVSLASFTNTSGSILPSIQPPRTFPPRPNYWILNPEVAAADALNDPIGYGIGEAMAFPLLTQTQVGDQYVYHNEAPDRDNTAKYNRKYARYIWYKKPTSADTLQLRGRIAYHLETELFSVPMNNTIVGGYHFIRDDVSFVSGSVGDINDFYAKDGREAEDPVYFRDSVFDYTPLRYNDEVLAIPGSRTQSDLGGIIADDLAVARSGWIDATLWYRGLYGIYQGQLWNDKLTLIGGLRRDSYQVKEKERLMIDDSDGLSDLWTGTLPRTVPGFIGYGNKLYEYRDDIPDELNEQVEQSIAAIRETQPNGTIEHSFPESQVFNTGTFGFSWRVMDDLSFYYLHSEGVFPNTGQRDGADNPIGAEQTENNEIGFKFDWLDGKISGTLSAYRIIRKNAVYYWADAPAPKLWHGGTQANADPTRRQYFSPQAAEAGGSPYLAGEYVPVTYGVAYPYVKKAFEEMGLEVPDPNMQAAFEDYGGFLSMDQDVAYELGTAYRRREFFVYANYDELKNNPNADVLRRAFELAMTRSPVVNQLTGEEGPYIGIPISYGQSFEFANNPSEGRGSHILFEEEGLGLDGQLILSPTPNYQVIFSYSIQNREVTGRGFTLVDAIDQETGTSWGTEYDYWIYVLGPENFDDPTHPSTYNGASVKGLDLSFVPTESFRLWNKYSFRDGPLDGFEVGGGVQYNGSVATSVAIGGSDLSQNRFMTPDVPERYVFDTFVSYRAEFWNIAWRFNLKLANVLNDDESVAYANYTNEYGTAVKRRTLVYYEPRSWRFSITARF